MPNQPVFGTLYTLDRFVYRQNSILLYCTIKEIIILKIACFGVIYVPLSRVITRYNVYFFTRVNIEMKEVPIRNVSMHLSGPCYWKRLELSKLDAVKNFKVPTTKWEVHAFSGITGIESLFLILHPLQHC